MSISVDKSQLLLVAMIVGPLLSTIIFRRQILDGMAYVAKGMSYLAQVAKYSFLNAIHSRVIWVWGLLTMSVAAANFYFEVKCTALISVVMLSAVMLVIACVDSGIKEMSYKHRSCPQCKGSGCPLCFEVRKSPPSTVPPCDCMKYGGMDSCPLCSPDPFAELAELAGEEPPEEWDGEYDPKCKCKFCRPELHAARVNRGTRCKKHDGHSPATSD